MASDDMELAQLAPDALFELPSEEAFVECFSRQDRSVKSLLTDQVRAEQGQTYF